MVLNNKEAIGKNEMKVRTEIYEYCIHKSSAKYIFHPSFPKTPLQHGKNQIKTCQLRNRTTKTVQQKVIQYDKNIVFVNHVDFCDFSLKIIVFL